MLEKCLTNYFYIAYMNTKVENTKITNKEYKN